MAVRTEVICHRISGFCAQEVKEHIYVVDFIRRKLDLHKSERGGTTCLRDQRHGGETAMVVSWDLCEVVESRSMRSNGIMVDLCCACGKFLCYVEIFA